MQGKEAGALPVRLAMPTAQEWEQWGLQKAAGEGSRGVCRKGSQSNRSQPKVMPEQFCQAPQNSDSAAGG